MDGMGEVVLMMRMEMMVRTLLDSSPAPRPSLHVTFAGGVLAVDTIICSSLSSPTILLFTHPDHRPHTRGFPCLTDYINKLTPGGLR